MNLIVRIPDELAGRLGPAEELERRALEALAIEEYKLGHLSKAELRRLLGIDSRYVLDGFLKAHDVYEPCTVEDVERDVETLVRLGF
jgi:hypothetical protein